MENKIKILRGVKMFCSICEEEHNVELIEEERKIEKLNSPIVEQLKRIEEQGNEQIKVLREDSERQKEQIKREYIVYFR